MHSRARERPPYCIQVIDTGPGWYRSVAATMLLDWLFGLSKQAGLRVVVRLGKLAQKIGFCDKPRFRVCQKLTVIDKKEDPECDGVNAPVMIKDFGSDSKRSNPD